MEAIFGENSYKMARKGILLGGRAGSKTAWRRSGKLFWALGAKYKKGAEQSDEKSEKFTLRSNK